MDDATHRVLRDHLQEWLRLPRRGIRFSEVVLALTGCKVLPFDRNDSDDVDLLARLRQGGRYCGTGSRQARHRDSETERAGNAIEPFVESALGSVGLKAARPQCRSGSGRSAGYPDLGQVRAGALCPGHPSARYSSSQVSSWCETNPPPLGGNTVSIQDEQQVEARRRDVCVRRRRHIYRANTADGDRQFNRAL